MSETLEQRRDSLLWAILPHVAFEGWTPAALRAGATDAGINREAAALTFPGGAGEVIAHWATVSDRLMLQRLQEVGAATLRIRERVATAVRHRIEVNVPHREAVRRTLSWLALPPNAPIALRLTYRTVDAIWYACGDSATDYSFYSKRATLAAVYGATKLYWLDDDSEDFGATWAFLDRRIEGVMQISKIRDHIGHALRTLLRPLAIRSGR